MCNPVCLKCLYFLFPTELNKHFKIGTDTGTGSHEEKYWIWIMPIFYDSMYANPSEEPVVACKSGDKTCAKWWDKSMSEYFTHFLAASEYCYYCLI